MNLEKLLKPFKYPDEQILRYYSKLTKKWEDKGHSRYSLAHGFNLPPLSYILTAPFLETLETTTLDFYLGPILGFFQGAVTGMDFSRNVLEPFMKKDTTNGTISHFYPMSHFYEKTTNFSRLPFFLAGAGLMGKGAYEIFDYVKTGNGSPNSAFSDLLAGYLLFGVSSSIYVKDSDPKLLDKEPFWKTAYNKIKGKIDSLIPQPEPIPILLSLKNYLLPNLHSKNF